jgi:hypothetical protein
MCRWVTCTIIFYLSQFKESNGFTLSPTVSTATKCQLQSNRMTSNVAPVSSITPSSTLSERLGSNTIDSSRKGRSKRPLCFSMADYDDNTWSSVSTESLRKLRDISSSFPYNTIQDAYKNLQLPLLSNLEGFQRDSAASFLNAKSIVENTWAVSRSAWPSFPQLSIPEWPVIELPELTFPSLSSIPNLDWMKVRQTIDHYDSILLGTIQQQLAIANEYIHANIYLQNLLDRISNLIATEERALAQSPTLLLVLSALVTYTIISSILSWGQSPPSSKPYPLDRYDPISARAYFDRRIPQVLARSLYVTFQSLQFGFSLLYDKIKYVLNSVNDFSESTMIYQLCARQ